MDKSGVIRVCQIPKDRITGLPARATIYKLHHLGKYPRLIYSVPAAGLCFDLNEWAAMCEAAKLVSVERAAQMQERSNEY